MEQNYNNQYQQTMQNSQYQQNYNNQYQQPMQYTGIKDTFIWLMLPFRNCVSNE